MEDKVIQKMEESIDKIMNEGLNTNNLDTLYKLSKIKHMAKEDKNMYGNYNGYSNYGRERYGEYGARGRDRRYRGDEYLDRMSGEYGRYMESRERYGAGEETEKAFHFMTKALGEYIDFLFEEAQTPQQRQELMQTLQSSMR